MIKKDLSFKVLKVDISIPLRKDSKGDDASTGRIITLLLEDHIYIVGSYIPNSGKDDNIKYEYRVNIWDPWMHEYLNNLSKDKHVIWIGDLNVALDNIDVSNVKTMSKNAGFTPGERNNFRNFLKNDWVDIWREQNPQKKEYTWAGRSRKPNYGMRIDNIILTKSLQCYPMHAYIMNNCPISTDHVIIGLNIIF